MMRTMALTVLAVTMGAKILGLIASPALLLKPDGVFPLQIRAVMMLAICFEAVCFICLFLTSEKRRVSYLMLIFIVPASLYRLAGTFLGVAHCPCLGSLTGWWPWLAVHQTAVLNTIAAWMFLSAVLVLARNPSGKEVAGEVVAA